MKKKSDKKLGMERPISRRDFVQGAAVVAGAALSGGGGGDSTEPPAATGGLTITGPTP